MSTIAKPKVIYKNRGMDREKKSQITKRIDNARFELQSAMVHSRDCGNLKIEKTLRKLSEDLDAFQVNLSMAMVK